MSRVLDATQPQKVHYAVPTWLRDEQIRVNTQAVPGRLKPASTLRTDPIAVVCFGPSLNETWEKVKDFKYVISCSGAHKFLIERDIVPSFHIEVDPRPHKVKLIGQPHPDVEYLIASACHPDVVEHLKGYKTTLWHVFDTADEGQRILPQGEYAITGGCSVGLRAMTMARFLGFTDLHIFGMDGNDGKTGKHAAAHPNQAKESFETVYDGVTYHTTPAFLEAARMTFHELDQMPDVKATFYGEGLVQHMARQYVPNHKDANGIIAFEKPELISADYRDLNARLHHDNLAYGVGGGKHADTVTKLVATLKTAGAPPSVLDYGCGKSFLSKALSFPIYEYDPAMPGKDETPRPADLVVCTDVLEHIEPEKLTYVLLDLKRCVKQLGYFVINTGPAKKTLPDGRNTHLIQKDETWWKKVLSGVFNVAQMWPVGATLHVLVSPLQKETSPYQFSFRNVAFAREPYVIGATQEVLTPAAYAELVANFPSDITQYRKFDGGDEKYSLSERNNPEIYEQVVAKSPVWSAFHQYIKSPGFREKILRVLKSHKVPLELDPTTLTSRFEFSMLPANGGLLRPHTDILTKAVTLIIPIDDGTWQPAWGGGTDVLVPNLGVEAARGHEYELPLSEFTKATTYDFIPNQCVVFIKSQDSWHSVGPLQGPDGQWRKSLTINIERPVECRA